MNKQLELLSKLAGAAVNPQAKDKLLWCGSDRESFTVKKCYSHLCSNKKVIESWPWKLHSDCDLEKEEEKELIWRTKLPTKVICYS
ncbi:hypothetical protein H5410_057285 [Solanum commersonii]|uniref:Uncharacterized protein n=1 Tax=Solanum commersonii TaxID=4109 RepID=A0A9J5WPN0_SOLCO|nr:hypothetical protein H5410_057285 [Solanum commersonii]